MRFLIELSGEHDEGLDSRDRFDAIVAEFREKLANNGFASEGVGCWIDASRTEPTTAEPLTVTRSSGIMGNVKVHDVLEPEPSFSYDADPHTWSKTDPPIPGRVVVRPKKSYPMADKPVSPPFEPTLAERIATLRAAASDAHMSQRELASALDVSRYAVRKALR